MIARYLWIVLTVSPLLASAQEWWFWPEYTLEQKARNYPGNRLNEPLPPLQPVRQETVPLIFYGEEPTERKENFLGASQVPREKFSLELWLVNHVNQPVGALVTLKSKSTSEEPNWLVGKHGKEILFSLRTQDSPFANLIRHELKNRGWKSYWFHVVAVYDGTGMQLFVNGEPVATLPVGKRTPFDAGNVQLEAAAYMKREPYMDFGNLVKMIHLHDGALNRKDVQARFTKLQKMVSEGKLFPDLFHFNAGPYLHYATPSSINMVWETDRPADFVVEYGEQLPLDKKVAIRTQRVQREVPENSEPAIYEVTLRDLKPGTPYFYNILASAHDGAEMRSGTLTFSTAVNDSSAISFAVVGDTEARPHINDRICKLIWQERPNFLLLVGDLTDGGKEDHKFEWNYEYFQGVTQLASRVPVYPVAGNGEDDLYWYKRYHALPDPEGYYSFTYGNAEFFMLNSNRPEEFAAGGAQYRWLEEKLKQSRATWKFVAHHHAPYSADDDDYGNAWQGKSTQGDPALRQIVPLYEKYGVDVVFFGHLHTYQRTLPIRDNLVDEANGVIYVQGGGGGGNLEDFAPSRAWFSAKTYRGHHYFTVTLHAGSFNLKMYDAEGALKDYLDLEKPSVPAAK